MTSQGRLGIRASAALGAVAALGASTIASAGIVNPQPKAGAPLAGLTAGELSRFNFGKTSYEKIFDSDGGLGPIFNKAGCVSCHTNPLGGWGSIMVTRFGFADKGSFDPLDALGGSLLQVAGTGACVEVVPVEANVIAMRLTNSSMAFGLVEAIDDAAILANADPDDSNADGISGRARIVELLESPGDMAVGRFGWKAQVATVLTFSGDATRNEMGVTNRLVETENAPNGDYDLLATCDLTPDPEDGPDRQGFDYIDRVTDFQRFLGRPPQTPKTGMSGEAIFNAIGCATCHVAQWQTKDDPTLEAAIRNQPLRTYSDYLLHDMGLLGDGIADGDAAELEIRTPTLWNLRTRDPMLHDGRAAGGTFAERIAGPGGAIWWHAVVGSEAQPVGEAFFDLPLEDQEKVVAFLDSLGRLEFDEDGNGHINLIDFLDFQSCYQQTGLTPDSPCALHDIDADGDVDDDDFDSFLVAYEGVDRDCDGDGTSDLRAILAGAPDANLDGVPDDCNPCVGDTDGSGAVDGADLGTLLSQWGGPGTADLNNDGTVDGADLGRLLSAWGDC